MVKPELGTKRVCVSCSAKFYDMVKVPAVCPKCGTEQPVEQPRVRRPVGNPIEDKRPKKPVIPEDAEPEAEAAEEEEEDVIEDASELEDDADAIGGELEVEPDTDEPER